jgi:hypothetical protein
MSAIHRLRDKKAYDSVRKVVMCNILIEFGVHMKLFRLIKTCLNETYSEVHIGEHFSYPELSKTIRCFFITVF